MKKEKLTLSVASGTKSKLEEQAKQKGFSSISSYLDAIALEQLQVSKPSQEISNALSSIQNSLKQLAKDAGCQHPNPDFNEEFGFYQCHNCGKVWAFDKDDPDYEETSDTLPGMSRVVIQTDNANFIAALASGDLDEVM